MNIIALARKTTLRRMMLVVLYLFIVMLSQVTNASAGQVTIDNQTQDWYCYMDVYGYFLGIQTKMTSACTPAGKTQTFHTSLSVGSIFAVCNHKTTAGAETCAATDVNFRYPKQLDTLTIGGAWLPHRNFTVTVTGNAISNRASLTFRLTEN